MKATCPAEFLHLFFVVSFLIFQYKIKSINITKRFGVSGDDPENDNDNANANVAVNEHSKSRSIVYKKSTNLGGMP